MTDLTFILLEIYQCRTLHLDTYSVYYTLLGAFYNFRMKYPLNLATFVDLGWPLRVAKHEKGSICDFYGLKSYWVMTSVLLTTHLHGNVKSQIPLCAMFINTAQILDFCDSVRCVHGHA